MWYKGTFFYQGKTRSYILVLNLLGLYILFGIHPFLAYFFIYFFEMNMWLAMAWSVIITGLVFFIGCFYVITFTRKYFKLFIVIAFIPFPVIRKLISDVKIGKYYPDNEKDHNLVYIFHDYDPWCEMGLCDWLEIELGDKSFPIGSNENHEYLLKKIEFELDRYM